MTKRRPPDQSRSTYRDRDTSRSSHGLGSGWVEAEEWDMEVLDLYSLKLLVKFWFRVPGSDLESREFSFRRVFRGSFRCE